MMTPPRLWSIPQSTELDQHNLYSLEQELYKTLADISKRFIYITVANSLSAEDMVIVHAIAKCNLNINVFVLNTGKLHAESISYLEKIKSTYKNIQWRIFTPTEQAIDFFSKAYDFAAIYQDVQARKACCYARKIKPLEQALKGYEAWITGQRREQAATRSELAIEEFEPISNRYKFNPLASWSQHNVWTYIQKHRVPTNPIYEKGMPSIGCEPCTKAIRVGEDIRAGRWWWENQNTKECGLHSNQSV